MNAFRSIRFPLLRTEIMGFRLLIYRHLTANAVKRGQFYNGIDTRGFTGFIGNPEEQ